MECAAAGISVIRQDIQDAEIFDLIRRIGSGVCDRVADGGIHVHAARIDLLVQTSRILLDDVEITGAGIAVIITGIEHTRISVTVDRSARFDDLAVFHLNGVLVTADLTDICVIFDPGDKAGHIAALEIGQTVGIGIPLLGHFDMTNHDAIFVHDVSSSPVALHFEGTTAEIRFRRVILQRQRDLRAGADLRFAVERIRDRQTHAVNVAGLVSGQIDRAGDGILHFTLFIDLQSLAVRHRQLGNFFFDGADVANHEVRNAVLRKFRILLTYVLPIVYIGHAFIFRCKASAAVRMTVFIFELRVSAAILLGVFRKRQGPGIHNSVHAPIFHFAGHVIDIADLGFVTGRPHMGAHPQSPILVINQRVSILRPELHVHAHTDAIGCLQRLYAREEQEIARTCFRVRHFLVAHPVRAVRLGYVVEFHIRIQRRTIGPDPWVSVVQFPSIIAPIRNIWFQITSACEKLLFHELPGYTIYITIFDIFLDIDRCTPVRIELDKCVHRGKAPPVIFHLALLNLRKERGIIVQRDPACGAVHAAAANA